MNRVFHLGFSILINGTVAVLIFLIYSWSIFGFYWAAGTPQVWLLVLLIVGLFILLVCWPVLNYLCKTKSATTHVFTGSFLGLLSVFIASALRAKYPVNFEYTFKRMWLY